MEPGAIKQPANLAHSNTTRNLAPTELPGVKTDMPARKAVKPVSAMSVSGAAQRSKGRPQLEKSPGERPPPETSKARGQSARIRHEHRRDTVTDTFVYRAIDENSGQVMRQLPPESLLRLRQVLVESERAKSKGNGLNRNY